MLRFSIIGIFIAKNKTLTCTHISVVNPLRDAFVLGRDPFGGYSCFEKGCRPKSVKVYATTPRGNVGSCQVTFLLPQNYMEI